MPKEGKPKRLRDLESKFNSAAKYRWEFMRRGKVYSEMWKKGQVPFDPELTFEKLVEKIIGELPTTDSRLSKAIAEAQAVNLLFKFGGSIEYRNEGHELFIKIDFTRINSIGATVRFLAHLVRETHEICKKVGYLPKRKTTFLKIEEPYKWNRILEAGDMYRKLKSLKSKGIFRQIAGKLFPDSLEPYGMKRKLRPTPTAISEATKLVKRYERLVEGGYKGIVYP